MGRRPEFEAGPFEGVLSFPLNFPPYTDIGFWIGLAVLHHGFVNNQCIDVRASRLEPVGLASWPMQKSLSMQLL